MKATATTDTHGPWAVRSKYGHGPDVWEVSRDGRLWATLTAAWPTRHGPDRWSATLTPHGVQLCDPDGEIYAVLGGLEVTQ